MALGPLETHDQRVHSVLSSQDNQDKQPELGDRELRERPFGLGNLLETFLAGALAGLALCGHSLVHGNPWLKIDRSAA